jgi:hypothetical protein
VKAALVAPAATATDAGTVIALLLLVRATLRPAAGAAVFKVTVQESEPAAENDVVAQEIPLSAAMAVPLRLTVIDAPVEELLAIVRAAVAAPAAVGLNCTVSVAVWPTFSVSGKAAPETVKPAPLKVAEFTVTATLPVELNVTVWLDVPFTATLPNVTLEALKLRVGIAAFSCSAAVCVEPFADAVSVAVCAVLTEAAVAVNAALAAPAGIETDAGTVTALVLLASATLTPPAGAAVFRTIVHEPEPAPVNDVVPHEMPLSMATPVPLRLIDTAAFVEELVASVSIPLAAPAAVGLNCTVSAADWPAFRVRGKVAPDTVNPAPVTVAELIVIATFPVEFKVRDWVEVEFAARFPNEMLVLLGVTACTAAFNCSAAACVEPFAAAVSVAVWAVPTEATVAVKAALVAPAATVTDAGTVTGKS